MLGTAGQAFALAALSCVGCWMLVTAMWGTFLPQTIPAFYSVIPSVGWRAALLAPLLICCNLGLMKAMDMHPGIGAATVTFATIVLPTVVTLFQRNGVLTTELVVVMVLVSVLCVGWLPLAISRALEQPAVAM